MGRGHKEEEGRGVKRRQSSTESKGGRGRERRRDGDEEGGQEGGGRREEVGKVDVLSPVLGSTCPW